ncbi:hypothetical protein LPJ78_004741 [Coemansia sp. RSA 989]|nr:A1 cistron-splicing factor [Coemansia mojavensis]KAJ1739813.1 hypothetical protein LPJ68_004338 [Coemansia sp. RSA 1086]KAJ1748258.1 hypothetical protein LPJ79_004675 [Coemansia sp. RSA 1821]KAJ1862394.1 hypothetical protein LPJ78_004741 [Coemansia sp. RSA 989]KAJ1875740.1 hypothetical protein LPJ55_000366 [Coemansia sp. RSA 990]KAJ2629494.1 hypothetical protein H4R22_003287 [Coemansia sp. RSA 1290]KAJ2651024.1 hypothetical protein IWW40_002043 [Coemansia sp. RSA 1250]KAJ2673486.1 hypothe
MDQNTARALFELGACLVILNAPVGIEFGIDLDTWKTGPLFKGIKMIPPGIHYVHYSVFNSEGQPGMRSGFFHNFQSQQLIAKQWSSRNEELEDLSEQDVRCIQLNIRDLDGNLGAYQMATYPRWQQLTRHITSRLLDQVLPAHGGWFSSATGSVYEDEEMDRVHRRLEQQIQSGKLEDSQEIRQIIDNEKQTRDRLESAYRQDRFGFTHIDIKRSFPKSASVEEIRRYSQDKSWLLTKLYETQWHSHARLLGEFELAFLVILVGQNFTGLEHWKRLLHLVLGSCEILSQVQVVRDLFVPLLGVLMGQLHECPVEFVASVLEQDNFVAEILKTFVLNVYECGYQEAQQLLFPEISRLRKLLATFDWTLPDGQQLQEAADLEEGEYAPQIVEL